MSLRSKFANLAFILILATLCSARVVAYEINTSSASENKFGGGLNDVFKNSQPEINDVLKGLSGTSRDATGTGSGSKGISFSNFFNFKNISTNDIGGIFKSVFGLMYKVLAVIVTVTIDALKGILGSISTQN